MTDEQNPAVSELRAFVERIEQFEAEKQEAADGMKDVYDEAKGRGYDTKAMRKIVALRKKTPAEIVEEQAVIETYLAALGMA